MSGQLWMAAKLQSLNDMVGNEDALRTLAAFRSGFLLIYGPVGCGKTCLALAWVKQRYGVELQEEQEFLRCNKLGLMYLKHAHAANFSIKDVRPRTFFNQHVESCYLIDESQLLTLKREQSLLKTIRMDEHTSIVLITQEENALEKSIRDRSCKVRLGPLSARELPALVKRGCELRGIAYDQAIVQACNGAGILRPRAILNVIDAVTAGTPLIQAVVGQE
jgi:DNA polymerase III delta prime subunit